MDRVREVAEKFSAEKRLCPVARKLPSLALLRDLPGGDDVDLVEQSQDRSGQCA
jgi:hypothetical protein